MRVRFHPLWLLVMATLLGFATTLPLAAQDAPVAWSSLTPAQRDLLEPL